MSWRDVLRGLKGPNPNTDPYYGSSNQYGPNSYNNDYFSQLNGTYQGPDKNQTQGNPNGVTDILHQFLGQISQLAPKQQPQLSTQDQLINQLLAGLNAGKPSVKTPDQIKKEALGAIGPQYDPQIKTIQQLMADSRKDSGLNAKEIKALYADLAGNYDQDADFAQKEIAKARSDEQKALGGLQGRADSQYDSQTADQIAEFKKLGIEDALPSATQGQIDDRSFLKGLNDTESSAQQRFLSDMGLSESNYYRRGAGIAQQRGNESVESLLGNLDQYLKQQGGELTALQGQKSGALSQLVSQMQQTNNTAYGNWDSDRWNRMAQMLGILNSNDKQSFDQQLALLKLQGGGGKDATKGIEGAYGVLNKLLGNDSTNTISALQNFLQQQTQREGSFRDPNNQPKDMTPQQAAYEARQYGAQMKLSPTEIDALVQSVYAYYGKLS